ncbi:MAG: hypothetical protein AAF264_05755 [Pseudomonadota bacterium]
MGLKSLVAAAFFAAAPATADTLEFWGPDGLYDQDELRIVDPESGVSATVAGGSRETSASDVPFPNATPCGTCVNQHDAGIGITIAPDVNRQIDNKEYLVLSFDRVVTLERVWFNAVDDGDGFDLAVDGVDVDVAALLGTAWLSDLPVDDLPGSESADSVADFRGDDTLALQGQVFTFYTDDHTNDYKLAAIAVDGGADPLPLAFLALAGGALLLVVLGGVVILRRRAA